MDHLDGNVQSRLAGNINNSSPVLLQHSWHVKATQAHTAQNVDFKKAEPVLIGDFRERLRFKDAKVIHQYVHAGQSAGQPVNAFSGAQVCRNTMQTGLLVLALDSLDSIIDSLLRAAVHDDTSAFLSKQGCDRKADSSS